MENKYTTKDLIDLAIQMKCCIQSVDAFYPDLARFNIIKRLVSHANKWDKIFTGLCQPTTKDGGI